MDEYYKNLLYHYYNKMLKNNSTDNPANYDNHGRIDYALLDQ